MNELGCSEEELLEFVERELDRLFPLLHAAHTPGVPLCGYTLAQDVPLEGYTQGTIPVRTAGISERLTCSACRAMVRNIS